MRLLLSRTGTSGDVTLDKERKHLVILALQLHWRVLGVGYEGWGVGRDDWSEEGDEDVVSGFVRNSHSLFKLEGDVGVSELWEFPPCHHQHTCSDKYPASIRIGSNGVKVFFKKISFFKLF